MAVPRVSKRALVKTFKDLVELYAPSRRERPVADYIKFRLAGRWPVTEDAAAAAVAGDAGNLLVTIDGEGPPLLLAAHMDAVEPCRGIRPRVRGGWITSAGETVLAADDRAAVAALVEYADVAARLPRRRALQILFTVSEEVGLLGAKHADYSAVAANTAFVLDASEPPGYAVNAAPGSDILKATFRGRAAHAGIEPEKGASAIQMAAAATAAMELGRIDFETTANIGIISGGRAVNIVPEQAELEGEVRSHDAGKLEVHVDRITAALKKAAADFGGAVDISWERAYEAYRIDEHAEPARLFRDAAARAGLDVKFVPGGGGSDANVFNARGIKSIVLGCGMEKPHATDERIAVASLVQLAELTTALATAA